MARRLKIVPQPPVRGNELYTVTELGGLPLTGWGHTIDRRQWAFTARGRTWTCAVTRLKPSPRQLRSGTFEADAFDVGRGKADGWARTGQYPINVLTGAPGLLTSPQPAAAMPVDHATGLITQTLMDYSAGILPRVGPWADPAAIEVRTVRRSGGTVYVVIEDGLELGEVCQRGRVWATDLTTETYGDRQSAIDALIRELEV